MVLDYLSYLAIEKSLQGVSSWQSSSLEDRLGPPYSFKETTQNLKNGGNTVINIIMLDVDVDFKRLVLAFALLFSIEATLIVVLYKYSVALLKMTKRDLLKGIFT